MTIGSSFEEHNGTRIFYSRIDDLERPSDLYYVNLINVSQLTQPSRIGGTRLTIYKNIYRLGSGYLLSLNLDLIDWAFIREFKIKTDSRIMTFQDLNPNRKVVGNGRVREQLMIQLDESELHDIIDSKSLHVQWGSNIYEANEDDIKRKDDFYQYVRNINILKSEVANL